MTRLRSCSVVPVFIPGRRSSSCKEKQAFEHELAQWLHCYVRPLRQIPSRLKMFITRIQTQRHLTALKQGVILHVYHLNLRGKWVISVGHYFLTHVKQCLIHMQMKNKMSWSYIHTFRSVVTITNRSTVCNVNDRAHAKITRCAHNRRSQRKRTRLSSRLLSTGVKM